MFLLEITIKLSLCVGFKELMVAHIPRSVQHNRLPRCKLQMSSAKTAMGQAEQEPDLPRSASNVLGKVQSLLCLTMAGRVEVQAGQVNFRGSLPRAANNVLQPFLHPGGG